MNTEQTQRDHDEAAHERLWEIRKFLGCQPGEEVAALRRLHQRLIADEQLQCCAVVFLEKRLARIQEVLGCAPGLEVSAIRLLQRYANSWRSIDHAAIAAAIYNSEEGRTLGGIERILRRELKFDEVLEGI